MVCWIERYGLPFFNDLGYHMNAEMLSELFVESKASVIAMNGDEDFGSDEFDKEFEFTLISVSGAMEGEVWSIDERCALLIKTVNNGVDASFISGDLACGVDERIRFSQFNFAVFALGNFEEGSCFFAL